MIITRNEINQLKEKELDIKVSFDKEDIKDIYLRDIKDVLAKIKFYDDLNLNTILKVKLKATLVCPCAISLEDVEVPIDLIEEFCIDDKEQDSYQFKNELNIKDLFYYLISKEIPIKVVKKGKIEYPIGDGWKVMTEEQLRESKKTKIDSQWEKLKNFLSDEEV